MRFRAGITTGRPSFLCAPPPRSGGEEAASMIGHEAELSHMEHAGNAAGRVLSGGHMRKDGF